MVRVKRLKALDRLVKGRKLGQHYYSEEAESLVQHTKNGPKTSPNGEPVGPWCRISDAFQTSAIEAIDDYKLKNLVELFNLSDSLLS